MNPTHQRPGKKAVLGRFYGSMDDEERHRKRNILIASGILITIVLGYCGYRLLWNYQNRLYLAIVAHDLDGVTRAVGEGIDVNAEIWDDDTPLICAAGHGNVDIAKALLDAGADVNMRTPRGSTALDFARRDRRQNIIDLLIAADAR